MHELRYFRPNAPVVLVGCKNDLRNDPTVVSMLARNGLTPIQYDEVIAWQLCFDEGQV